MFYSKHYTSIVMDDLVSILYKIHKKPELYFGSRKTVTDLENFILGFVMGRNGTNKEIKQSDNFFSKQHSNSFQNFVVTKHEFDSSKSWSNCIEYVSASENSAFDLFFNLLDEYLEK